MKRTFATVNYFQFNSQEESPMTNKLQQYFPMLRTREEIIHEIEHRPNLRCTFYNWSEKARNEFLDFTTGAKGVKMMYDFASKELLNPETHRERVNERVQQKNSLKDSHAKVHYKDIKNVYTIVLFEKSPKSFYKYPNIFLHHFEQYSDTGLELDLLQKYLFVPLDIFKEIKHNESIPINLKSQQEA